MTDPLKTAAAVLTRSLASSIDAAFQKKYGVAVRTRFSIISMNLVTDREDKRPFTEQQLAFLEGYGSAFLEAIEKVHVAGEAECKPSNLH